MKKRDDDEPVVDELLLTSKELKLLRKKSREEKKRKKEQKLLKESADYERIKKKLDSIPNVYGTDDHDDDSEYDSKQSIDSDELDIQHIPEKRPHQSKVPENNYPIIEREESEIQNTPQSAPDLVKPRQTQEAGRVIQNQVMSPPIDETGDVDLNKLFSSEVGNESDVVKELFTQENIKVKTELSSNEISIISRLELQASMTQNFFLTKVIKELEVLRVSKERKSRSEFVSSFSGMRETNSGVTAFTKLGNIFKNDKV